jgi:hypothetical protein
MSDNKLLTILDRPEELEQLYRTEPKRFRAWLDKALLVYPDSETLKVWFARLNYTEAIYFNRHKSPLVYIIILSLLPGLLIKLPAFFPIEEKWYYPRFIPFAIFSMLVAYFYRRIEEIYLKIVVLSSMVICFLIAITLPHHATSDSLTMSQIHMPLVLLTLLGVAFMARSWRRSDARLLYIRYLGEIVIYSTLMIIGGIVLALMSFGLFSLIGLSIEKWYTGYIVVFGLAASPIVATYLYDGVLGRDSKVATLISNIFSPLFLITVSVYLLAVLIQGKSPYSDRDFLIMFNGLLIIVWGITVFSIAGIQSSKVAKLSDLVNISLISVTLIINAIALSAIMFRLSEYGITPNRVAVTGSNILIFVHLILILKEYIKNIRSRCERNELNDAVANYLPVYSVWSFFIVIALPILFRFK